MDAAFKFAKFAESLKYDELPADVVEMVKRDFTDCLGNMLGGSREPEVTKSLAVMRELGGTAESTVLPYGDKLPCTSAAFINAQMINALDFDDTNEEAIAHIGAPIFAAVLAVAERVGGVSGKDAITAIAAGLEISSRLGKYANGERGGWDHLPVLGFFSAAVAAGRLLGLTEEEMLNALGIAFHQAAGNNLSVIELADTKVLSAGIGARGGVFSALLAQKGLSGAHNVFDESPYSYMYLYKPGCDREGLVAGLGEKYDMMALSFKPHSCSRGAQKYADAAIALATEHDIKPDEILSIRCACAPGDHLRIFAPTPSNIAPPTMIAGKFSMPWIVSCAAVRRRVSIEEFSLASLSDETLLATAAKCDYILDETAGGAFDPALVRIETKRGVFERWTGIPYGDPRNPMSAAAVRRKFHENAEYGWPSRTEEKLEALLQLCETLETVPDITEIARIIAS